MRRREPRSNLDQIAGKSDTVYSIAIADMNGDGYPDIVLGNSHAQGAVLINYGTGRRFKRVSLSGMRGVPSMVWLLVMLTAMARPTSLQRVPMR